MTDTMTLLQKRMTGMVSRVRLPSSVPPERKMTNIEVPGENGLRYAFTIDDPASASG